MRTAVEHVNTEIADAVVGLDASDQRLLDDELVTLDGTDGKRRLGANAILGVSLAAAKAAADEAELPLYRYVGGANAHVLPVPFMNVLNGGAHADSNVDVQEFMLAPVGAASFAEALRWGVETYHALKALLKERGLSTALGDEGGFAPDLPSNEEALALLLTAIERAGYTPGDEIALALDVASTELFTRRSLRARGRRRRRTRRRSGPTGSWSCATATRSCRSRTACPRTTGTAGPRSPTRARRRACSSWATTCSSPTSSGLQQGIDRGVANSILVKVNQIGTLSETLDTMFVAGRHGYTAMMSHRSGETEDATIADLAVATNCGQIKTGAPARSDRVAKYNQLLRIEEELGPVASYLGAAALPARAVDAVADAARREAARGAADVEGEAGERARRSATRSRAARGAGRRCGWRSSSWCSSGCCSRSCIRPARSSTSATRPTRRARSSTVLQAENARLARESKRLSTDSEIERLARREVRAGEAGRASRS